MKKAAATYLEKLKDPRWQQMRLRVFERDGWCCQSCNATQYTLVVHHRYYLKGHEPWDYPIDALITLCEDCHSNEKNEPPMFSGGRRDDDIFRVAYFLKKGGAHNFEISQVVLKLAESCGISPSEATLMSRKALDLAEKKKSRHTKSKLIEEVNSELDIEHLLKFKEQNVSATVREIVDVASGIFNIKDIYIILKSTERKEKKYIASCLSRLCKDGIIERLGEGNGKYCKVIRATADA